MSTRLETNATLIPGECRPADEYANLVTHGLGLCLSVVAAFVLMSVAVADGAPERIAGCAVYCISLVSLYAASTLSHAFHDVDWRRFFRMLDQACIYLLIAGSFTPFAVVFLRHGWWPLLLVAMWTLALCGVVLVLRVRNLSPAAKLTYGLLGWLPVICLKTLFDAVSLEIMGWIVAGGLFYTVGTLFLRYDQCVRYSHALWHTFVIAGSTCHWLAILLILVRE